MLNTYIEVCKHHFLVTYPSSFQLHSAPQMKPSVPHSPPACSAVAGDTEHIYHGACSTLEPASAPGQVHVLPTDTHFKTHHIK